MAFRGIKASLDSQRRLDIGPRTGMLHYEWASQREETGT